MEQYSKEEFDKAKTMILKDQYRNLEEQSQPYAAVLGGQPGAGKTTIQTMLKQQYSIGIINGDDYRRYHPRFKELQSQYGADSVKYTQKFAGEMTETIIEELSNRKYNLAIEGTLRTIEAPLKTCDLLKGKGYKVDLFIMAVKPEISYESTIVRYEEAVKSEGIARATPKEHHDGVVKIIACNLSEIYGSKKFENIYIYNRDKECLYNQNKMLSKDPGDIIREYHKQWTDKEKAELKEIINQNLKLKKERNSKDYESYFERVIQIPIYMDKRLVDVKYEVERAGFEPTVAIINSIEKLNRAFGKIHSVSEIKEMYKNKESFSKDEQDRILDTVQEFKEQELQKMNVKFNANQIEPEPLQ